MPFSSKTGKPLTPRQERYVRERLKGKTAVQSYTDAGYSPKGSRKTVSHNAYTLDKDERIRAKLADLTRRADAGMIMDARQIQQTLTDMAYDESKPDGIRLKAIDQLSKIQALYSDGNQILTVGQLTIGDKRAKIDELLDI